jgi:hypothetical protein
MVSGIEIISHVALGIFTNYVNLALKTGVDFPHVVPRLQGLRTRLPT